MGARGVAATLLAGSAVACSWPQPTSKAAAIASATVNMVSRSALKSDLQINPSLGRARAVDGRPLLFRVAGFQSKNRCLRAQNHILRHDPEHAANGKQILGIYKALFSCDLH